MGRARRVAKALSTSDEFQHATPPIANKNEPLTAEKRVAIAAGARAELARRSLFHFFVQSWHILEPDTPLEVSWHHKLACDIIQGILVDWRRKKRDPSFRQRVRSAIFNLPPGTTKSRIISVAANAWMWIDSPTWSVMCLSANPFVATRDAGYCRDIVESEWYRQSFEITWTIREDINALGNFVNSMGGRRLSFGLTSKIIGARSDAIFIDDPNDMYEVFSEAERRKVNGKFDSAIYNRVNDTRSAVRVLMQQRGHEDDLSGHWLRKGEKGLLHVCLPMEFDAKRRFESVFGADPRNDNAEPLHGIRFDAEFIASERTRLGTFGFEAQYNQNPGNLDGGMFHRGWFRFFSIAGRPSQGFTRPLGCANTNELPALVLEPRVDISAAAHWSKKLPFDQIIVTVDASFGSTTQAASNVGLAAIGTIGKQRYVLDDRTDVMTFPQTKKAVRQILDDYPGARRTLIENKANGPALIQELEKEISGLIAINPEGGKTARAHAMSPGVESGNWYLLEGAPWLVKFIEEVCAFPNGKQDDRVDMCSQLDTYCSESSSNTSKWKAMAR